MQLVCLDAYYSVRLSSDRCGCALDALPLQLLVAMGAGYTEASWQSEIAENLEEREQRRQTAKAKERYGANYLAEQAAESDAQVRAALPAVRVQATRRAARAALACSIHLRWARMRPTATMCRCVDVLMSLAACVCVIVRAWLQAECDIDGFIMELTGSMHRW